jgi:transcriptional regulator with XRE-family HTH domain
MNRLNSDILAISNRIRDLITKKGVSDQSVSRGIGKSPSYISNILSGRNKPSIEALFCLCDFFDITIQEFFDYQTANPMVDRKVITEIKRLTGDCYEALPTSLHSFSTTDAQVLMDALRIMRR